MNPEITLRRATEKDAAALANAIEKIIAGIPYYTALAKQHEILRYSAAALTIKIKEDPHSVILACVDNETAGFCISRFDDYTIWLEWFGVTEKYRGAGITKQLLQALENTVAVDTPNATTARESHGQHPHRDRHLRPHRG